MKKIIICVVGIFCIFAGTAFADNTMSLRNQLAHKLTMMDEQSLIQMSEVADAVLKMQAGNHKKVTIMAFEVQDFPVFLEKVLDSNPRLKKIPRERGSIVVLQNPKVPGVQNVYIKVPAEFIQKGDGVLAWMPAKYASLLDLRANRLAKRGYQNAYQTLLWWANKDGVLKPIKTPHGFDWRKMGHGDLLVPLATLNPVTESLL